jgi:tetratricopeptide (TPR) repeat protein
MDTPASLDAAELIRTQWNFADAKQTEQRFRELSASAFQQGDAATALQLQTQVARAQGLDQRFAEASATLAEVEARSDRQPAVVRVRLWLEQGRVLNSSDQPEPARPLFLRALELARAEGLDGLAVDAAHMVAITFLSQPDEAIAWNDRALELARASSQPDARNWLGSLLNNQGWTYYDKGQPARALELFEEGLAFRRQAHPHAKATRIAQWCVAKALRALGQTERALQIQEQLLTEKVALGEADGFVQEEIGECYLALGDAERARGHFARAHAELSKDSWLARKEGARLQRIALLGGVASGEG